LTPALAPEQEQQPLSQQYDGLFGENNRDLPEQLVNLIKGTIKEFQKQDTYLRRREVMRDRKARFYERGFQHLAWTGTGQSGGFAQISSGIVTPGSSVQAPQYVDDYDIFYPTERIVLSILTQNLPGVDFQPNDPNRTEDIEAANTAEGYSQLFDRNNNVKSIQMQGMRYMLLGGRTISWTRTVQNGAKFGYNDGENGEQGTAKSIEITTEYGTLESRVPIMAKCQDDALYVFLYDDPQVKQAKSDYPWIKEKIQGNQGGLGENQYERLARLGALQGSRQTMATGESFSYLTTRMYCWLRPACFEGKDYEEELEGTTDKCGDILRSIYPDGACFTFIGETYAESYAEPMDDHIDIAFAYEGDGMYRKAPMDCMLVNQDAFNDAMNATRLIFDVGWPRRYINTDKQDFDAMVGQVATPYALTLLKVKADGKASDQVYQEEQPMTPPSFDEYKGFLIGELTQYQTATPPALWGAQMEDQKTAHGYAQAQQSAMGQLGPLYGVQQHHFANIRYQAALCAAKNPDYAEPIVVAGNGKTAQSLTLTNITKGKFRCHPDEDSSFPETTAAKRATLTSVIDMLVQAQSPVGAEILGAPDNVGIMLQQFGLAELVIPQVESRDTQQIEIEELLQQAPTVSPMALQGAMQMHADATLSGQLQPEPFDPSQIPPDQPSVPINDYDYHQFHAQKCQDWLNGPDCLKQKAAGNTQGIQNVVLHWKAHVAAMVAMMPPPMPAEGEGGGGEGKPPAEKEKGTAPTDEGLAGPPPGTPPGPPPGPPLI
jgi:hypothetical protein